MGGLGVNSIELVIAHKCLKGVSPGHLYAPPRRRERREKGYFLYTLRLSGEMWVITSLDADG
jgi:hypothetical protein